MLQQASAAIPRIFLVYIGHQNRLVVCLKQLIVFLKEFISTAKDWFTSDLIMRNPTFNNGIDIDLSDLYRNIIGLDALGQKNGGKRPIRRSVTPQSLTKCCP